MQIKPARSGAAYDVLDEARSLLAFGLGFDTTFHPSSSGSSAVISSVTHSFQLSICCEFNKRRRAVLVPYTAACGRTVRCAAQSPRCRWSGDGRRILGFGPGADEYEVPEACRQLLPAFWLTPSQQADAARAPSSCRPVTVEDCAARACAKAVVPIDVKDRRREAAVMFRLSIVA